jgi:UDP-N-acetyl-D-glucosamine dehydrogenase
MRMYDFALASVALSAETLRAHDCALIVTDHSCIDYQTVVDESPLVVDTRNATGKLVGRRGPVVRC